MFACMGATVPQCFLILFGQVAQGRFSCILSRLMLTFPLTTSSSGFITSCKLIQGVKIGEPQSMVLSKSMRTFLIDAIPLVVTCCYDRYISKMRNSKTRRRITTTSYTRSKKLDVICSASHISHVL